MKFSEMPLQSTTITGDSIRLLYADNPDRVKATMWVDLSIPLQEVLDERAAHRDAITHPLGAKLKVLLDRALLEGRRFLDDEIGKL